MTLVKVFPAFASHNRADIATRDAKLFGQNAMGDGVLQRTNEANGFGGQLRFVMRFATGHVLAKARACHGTELRMVLADTCWTSQELRATEGTDTEDFSPAPHGVITASGMVCGMGCFGKQFEILQTVIGFAAIDMVDNFPRQESTAKMLAHDEAVFEDSTLLSGIGMLWHGEQDIPILDGTSLPMIVTRATRVVAWNIANSETALELEVQSTADWGQFCPATATTLHRMAP